jgi:hypothetical protein
VNRPFGSPVSWSCGLAVAVLVGSAAAAAENVPPPGFTAIFNGTDLSGWYGWGTRDPQELRVMSAEDRADYLRKSVEGGLLDAKGVDKDEHLRAHWRVENGELVNDGKGLYATTDRDYGDFDLHVDWKMLPLGDSGVYLRGIPQVQIWDSTNEKMFKHGAEKGSGGLWNNKGPEGRFPTKLMDRPFGEWNTFKIRMIGERVTVNFNGEDVVVNAPLENFFANRKAGYVAYGKPAKDGDDGAKPANGFMPDPVSTRGPIQLQTHGSEIRWRNVFVRGIPADEANRLLAARDADGFVELVNGRDLTGWQGAVDSYEVKDGSIVCRPGKGGDLLTNDEYEDVVIRTEFRLPEAGNNGIALRTPPGAHSSSDGLELQVIDSDGYNAKQAAAGKPGLTPHQYHGSLYHCVGAKHGYLRPAGAWNFQEIVVRGQRITVTLNGTKILDVDIDALDRAQIEKPPKGLDRRKGHIGFAGHSDPVEYRSFRVKRL